MIFTIISTFLQIVGCMQFQEFMNFEQVSNKRLDIWMDHVRDLCANRLFWISIILQELIVSSLHLMECKHLRAHVPIILREVMSGQCKLVALRLITVICALSNLILIQ